MNNTDLQDWVAHALDPPDPAPALVLIAGDASPRRYYRVTGRAVLVVVAPDRASNTAFLQVRALLAAAGVVVPAVHAEDLARGFLLIEDFGDNLLLPMLSDHSVGAWYGQSLAALTRLVAIDPATANLPAFDAAFVRRELALFPEWFLAGLLGRPPSDALAEAFSALTDVLVATVAAQPQVVMHRDYHSRNLLALADGELGVIDFQDAVIGPVTYDPVSLLKDCYIAWPRRRQLAWLRDYQSALEADGLIDPVAPATFLRWFDLTGLQRHLKVLGIFARLKLRDGKPGYLADLPRVITYVEEVLALYADSDPAIAGFARCFADEVTPVVRTQPWSEVVQ